VSKDALLAWLRANEVRVEEVAHLMDEGQLKRVFDAIRRQGGTPELLEFARLPERNIQASPPPPHGDSPSTALLE
jgi:hypothetical protein